MHQLEQLELQLDTAPDSVRLVLDSISSAPLRSEAPKFTSLTSGANIGS